MEWWQLQGGGCGSGGVVAVQQRDGGGSSGGDGSLVTARRLQHLAAARWRWWQHGDSLAAAAQQWKWRRHHGNSLAAGGFCSLAQAARRWQLGLGSSATERGRWRQRRQKSVVFVHISESAAPRCECLATLLKGKLLFMTAVFYVVTNSRTLSSLDICSVSTGF